MIMVMMILILIMIMTMMMMMPVRDAEALLDSKAPLLLDLLAGLMPRA